MIRNFILLSNLIFLMGCEVLGSEYVYHPSSIVPASIDYRQGIGPETQTPLLTGEKSTRYSYWVNVYKVDGAYTHTSPLLPSDNHPLVVSNKIFLSPGAHAITFQIISGMTDGTVDYMLNAKSGVHYFIRLEQTTDSSYAFSLFEESQLLKTFKLNTVYR